MKTIIQSLKTIVLASVIGLGVAYAMAWTGPTQSPPSGNVPAPVNTGSSAQAKSGIFETYNDAYFATKGGSVGIGTTNPVNYIGWKGALDVAGQVKAARYYDDNRNYYIDSNVTSVMKNIRLKGSLCLPGGGCRNSWPALNYGACYGIWVGRPSGPHTTYCRPGYITVGGYTDGNDWIPEGQVCCRLEGIRVINWGSRWRAGRLE